MVPPLQVAESDLKNIQAPLVLRIYRTLFEGIMDTDAESLQPPFSIYRGDYPEVHQTFLEKATFAMCMRWLLAQAGAEDFMLKDLNDPKPKRTNKFLSALINYYMFVGQRIQVYDEMKTNKEEEEEQLGHLREANDILQRQIDDIKSERAAQEPQCKKLNEEANKLETVLDDLVQQKREVVQLVQDTKTQVAKTTETNERNKELLSQKKEEVTAMDAQIIQSPARMKDQIENMVDKKNRVRTRMNEQAERQNEMDKKMKDEERFLRDTEGALKVVKEVSNLLAKEASLMDEKSQIESRIVDVQTRCRELHRMLEALENECENREQKKQRATVNKQLRHTSLKADIQARERGLEQVKETARQKSDQQTDLLKEMQNIKTSTEEKIDKNTRELHMMKAKYSELLEALDNYHTRLAAQHQQTAESLHNHMQDTWLAFNTTSATKRK